MNLHLSKLFHVNLTREGQVIRDHLYAAAWLVEHGQHAEASQEYMRASILLRRDGELKLARDYRDRALKHMRRALGAAIDRHFALTA